jgi:hypothetical protein
MLIIGRQSRIMREEVGQVAPAGETKGETAISPISIE